MIIVSDTSPISGLFLIGQLELLPKIFGKVIIPSTVAKELEQLTVFGHELDMIFKSDWLSVRVAGNSPILEQLRQDLDPGEAEAITLAKELGAGILIIDEIKGRKIAMLEGLKIIGVLGILIEAKEIGLIQLVQPMMDELRLKAKFRISPSLYQAVLKQTGEKGGVT